MGKKKQATTPSLFNEDSNQVAENTPNTKQPPEFPLPANLAPSWLTALTPETHKPYWADLQKFVAGERAAHTVFPPEADVFNAFRYTPLDQVKVLLLGQDPYPGTGHAHGLCFSVRPGVRLPGSLRNIYQELTDDLGLKTPKHGYLASWAKQGVLMLNACLSVRADAPNSHANKGWEKFTDAVITVVNERKQPVVFLLWGAYAQKKIKLIDETRHVVIKSAHPSPLSAANGFFGSKPFSKINAALKKLGETPIDWQLPERVTEES
ncbi:MAG: uracil-DNA glycosylase [Planctomycetes bacterium]|nr:uracil-DNA glycosylase [Planctomycetota bacterium]